MLKSLRFRLPALFLAGIVIAGVIATVIAIELFQNYTHDRALDDLGREASGVARLFERQESARPLAPKTVQEAVGDRFYYAGVTPFPGEETGLPRLPPGTVDKRQLRSGHPVTFEFTPPGEDRRFLAAGHPVTIRGHTLGLVIAAEPEAEVTSRWLTLVGRLAIAFAGGVLVAALLASYLSRRISRPLLDLAAAADQIAEGRYGVDIPAVRSDDEIRHLADRFREMAVRLAEAEALERNFLMSVSHELRTPLTAIRGHVEALLEGVVEDEQARLESLEVISHEAERLERLVGDVLDLAKLDAHRFTLTREEVDMERVCERAYSAFGEEARRRGIDYRREVAARPVIVTDGDRVLQIITNLLSNAFRWTPDGGRIELALDASNGHVAVAVDDTGPGIRPADRERIFRPFWSRDGHGTGLGLTIARELATALGGRIELQTTPGRGSRFELVLPAGGRSG